MTDPLRQRRGISESSSVGKEKEEKFAHLPRSVSLHRCFWHGRGRPIFLVTVRREEYAREKLVNEGERGGGRSNCRFSVLDMYSWYGR